jgi:hypothetical protein
MAVNDKPRSMHDVNCAAYEGAAHLSHCRTIAEQTLFRSPRTCTWSPSVGRVMPINWPLSLADHHIQPLPLCGVLSASI